MKARKVKADNEPIKMARPEHGRRVFVGLSGGVDSAVSAALLKKQGCEVVGVFIKTWHPDFLECNEEEERRDAMRVAAHLDIPFLTFDLEKEYKKGVADYMISEYRAGRTPNPDVMCNREVKFGAFMERALSMGADYVATGHYANNTANDVFLSPTAKIASAFEKHRLPFSKAEDAFLSSDDAKQDIREKKHLLRRGIDKGKDQSYFLWTLKPEQLSNIIFPIGHLRKTEVRLLAKKFDLPVSEKRDSQGICFLGQVDLKEFLQHYIKPKKGEVVNQAGDVLGHHDGVTFFTLGERRGFTITHKTPNDRPYYVVGKDIKRNTLIVSENPKATHNSIHNVGIKNTNWILKPNPGKEYTAQIRYHGELLKCYIQNFNKNTADVIFDKPVLCAPGQSVVLYDRDICLGGGVVV